MESPSRPPRNRARLRRAALALILILALGVPFGRHAWPKVRREVRLRLAERAVALGRLDEAELRLLPLIRERPEETRPRLLRVEIERRLGRTTDAEEALQRTVELGLPVEQGRREFALLTAGQDFSRAEPSLRKLLKDRPGDLEVHRALAEGHARAGRRGEAEAACSAWLARDPGATDALLLRARTRRDLGHREEAEADFLAARKLLPGRPEPLVGLAGCATDRGDLDEAGSLLDRALALAPSSAPALAARGNLFLARGRGEKAIPLLERLALLDPRDKLNLRTLARLRRRAGDEAGAVELERRAGEPADGGKPGEPVRARR